MVVKNHLHSSSDVQESVLSTVPTTINTWYHPVWDNLLQWEANTGWGDESWTAFCGPAAAAVGGLRAER